MSLLREHFDRVREAAEQGLPLTEGIFVDVGGTLVHYDSTCESRYSPDLDLVDFLMWNNEKKLLGPNHIFTTDLKHSGELIQKMRISIKSYWC